MRRLLFGRLAGALVIAGGLLVHSSTAAADGDVEKRDDWFLYQRRYPSKEIPKDALKRAFEQRKAIPEARRGAFQRARLADPGDPFTPVQTTFDSNVAPSWGRMSGRTRDLAITPGNPSRMFLASATGGIWRTTDGGTNWTPVTDSQNSLAASAVAIDPENVATVYAGTGEGPEGAYYGVGVLKSTNGGDTFTLTAGPFARHAISNILVDPVTSSVVLVCSTAARFTPGDAVPFDPAATGVFRSTDAGMSYPKISSFTGVCDGLFAVPSNFDVLYASRTGGGNATDGIWKSIDRGMSFAQLTSGGAPTQTGTLAIGISTNGATIYAGGKDSAAVTTIWKSTDSGGTWAALAGAPNYCEKQCGYDNVIGVDPNNANIAYFGGVGLYRTTDGGGTFAQVGDTNSSTTRQVHVDHHILKYQAGSSSILYNGNDGGIYKSLNANGASTPTWTSLSGTSLATMQPVFLALHPTDPNIMLAGYQDNGTELRSPAGGNVWNERCGGDGASALIDFTTPSEMYCSFAGSGPIGIMKSTDGGVTFPSDVSVPTGMERRGFNPPVILDPNTSTTLYAGSQRLWWSTNGGTAWAARSMSSDLTGGTGEITRIAVAKSTSMVIYVVTSDGKVQASSDGGQAFMDVTAAPLPARYATSVAVDPTNPAIAYVGYSGFNDATPGTPGHIYRTTNSGGTWTDISGTLPDNPVSAIAIRPTAPAEIYAGMDVGMFLSTDSGGTWAKMTNGMPNVAIMDIKVNTATDLLAVATYGRSIFKSTLTCPPLAVVTVTTTGFLTVCTGSTGGTATVSDTGGGTNQQQWGYRTSPMGTPMPIAGQTGTSYVINPNDFPGTGTYYLYCQTTPTCGSPVFSMQTITINIITQGQDNLGPAVSPPAALTVTQTLCQ